MHLQRLVQVFTQAGLNVRLGSFDPELTAPRRVALPDGSELVVEPLVRKRTRLGLKDFDPCTILLNNDLRGGVPRVLQNLHEQYLLPPLHAGWAARRKSKHFHSYEEVAKKFAKLLGMDPWLINPMAAQCGEVDTASAAGLDCVQRRPTRCWARCGASSRNTASTRSPSWSSRPTAGGMGAGVLTVRDARELDAARLARALARPEGEPAG
jgi:glutamate--cysteine ligase